MSPKSPKISSPIKNTIEMYDIVYNDIMHLWTLLPKDDFWVARQFIQSSIDYLHQLHEIRKHYEQSETTGSN